MNNRRSFLSHLIGVPFAGALGSGLPSLGARRAAIRHVVDPTDFGARGDGQHDDTEAIRCALLALPRTGGAVFFPPGVYRITDSIQIDTPSLVTGAGPRQSRLFNESDGRPALVLRTGTERRVDGAVVEKLGFIGTEGSGPALRVEHSIRCAFYDLQASTHPVPAYQVVDSLSCVFMNVQSWHDAGALLMTAASNSNRFYEFRAQRGSGEAAIEMRQSDNAAFFGGVVEENAHDGMVARAAHVLAIYGARFEQNATSRSSDRAHLKVFDTEVVTVDGCVFSGVNVRRRIIMQGVGAIRVTGNLFASGNIVDLQHDADDALIAANKLTRGVTRG